MVQVYSTLLFLGVSYFLDYVDVGSSRFSASFLHPHGFGVVSGFLRSHRGEEVPGGVPDSVGPRDQVQQLQRSWRSGAVRAVSAGGVRST